MKTQASILQSAATIVLACSSASNAALLQAPISSASFASVSSKQPFAFRPLNLNPFPHTNQHPQSSYHTTFTSTTQMSMSSTTTTTTTNGNAIQALLPYTEGSHNSANIIIPCDQNNNHQEADIPPSSNYYNDMTMDEFKTRLLATIETCKQLSKSALWVQVPMSKARFIECMHDIDGLNFHHTTNDDNHNNYVHLSIWLKDNDDNKIPEYATHQVGVGAIVVNSRDEILCVREIRNNYRPWKIPGGLAEIGECLNEAASREVLEETGIDCHFQSVVGFRHTHNLQFGRSDLYFVCRMTPVEQVDEEGNVVIPQPVAQENEIAAVSWVPMKEYKAMVNEGEKPHPMMQKILALYESNNDIQATIVSSIVPGRKPSPIYCASEKK